jgi:hypothetical protein
MSLQSIRRQSGIAPLVLAAALLACSGAANAGSESLTAAESHVVSRLNVHLATIVSGGHWCRGEEEGFYRVVVYSDGIEEVYHHLYIQLLQVDLEKHDVLVDRTWPVKEAQGLDLVFSNLKLAPAASAPCADALVEADVLRRSIDGPRAERFRMRINAAGDHQVTFEPAAGAANRK